MLSENERRWACAMKVLKDKGDAAPMFVSERIGALSLAGGIEGVDTWKAIASPIDRIILASSA